MTIANVNIKKVLFRRGNTVQNNNYTGVNGEISVDTEANTLRVHDGSTAGGTRLATYAELSDLATGNLDLSGYATSAGLTAANVEIGKLRANITAANVAWTANAATQATAINSINANLGAFQTYANATFTGGGSGTYSNTNVAAFLGSVTGNIIPSANAQYSLGSSTRWWRDIYVGSNTIYLAGVPLSIDADQNLLIDGNVVQGGNVDAVNSNVSVIDANIGAYQRWANTNAAAQSTSLSTINANIGAYQTWANGNSASQTTSINTINANVAAANAAITSNYNFLLANAGVAHSEIDGLRANVTAANATIASNYSVFVANASAAHSEIDGLRANIIASNAVVNTFQANVGSFYTWANTNFGTSSYANANVASYLPTYSGTLTAGNATIGSYTNGQLAIRKTNDSVSIGVVGISSLSVDSGGDIVMGGTGNVRITGAAGSQVIIGGGSTGNVTVPSGIVFNDGTKQTTAYTGYGNTSVAAYLAGAVTTGNLTTGNLTIETNAVVLGNLRVLGTQTTVNASTLNITDLYVTVADGAVQASDANGAGLRIEGALANIEYSSVSDSFDFNKPITVGTLTASSALKTNLINNVNPGQQIAIDPDNTNLAYIKVGGFDDGGERVSISNQFTNSAGIYFYTENSTFRMYQDQFKFADDTWQSTAWLGTVANLTLGANVVSLGIDGNLTLPNNMIFTTSPAVSGTGIIFGDGTYQYTAAGLPDRIVNGPYKAYLEGADLVIENAIKTPPGEYYVATSDTSTEMSWGNSVQAPNTGVYSGIGSDSSGTSIQNASTDGTGAWVFKTWAFDMTGNLTVPGAVLPTVDNTQDLGSATMRFRHLYVGPGTVYVGNAAIKTTATGNLILPGLTRAVASSAYAEEINDRGSQTHSFATVPTVIDNAQYELLTGGQVSSFTPAQYSVDALDGDGYIDGISIDRQNRGSGYSGDVANLAEQNMWATEAADPINNFNIGDWIQIPFQVQTRAGESEYEFGTGGGTDTGDITFDGYDIGSTANIVNITASQYAQLQSGNNYIWVDNSEGSEGAYIQLGGRTFEFTNISNSPKLKLPAGGDIVDSTGTSVLGGGSGGVVERTVNYPTGEAGDTAGTLALTPDDNLYICIADYAAVQAVEYDQEPASENFSKGQTNDMVFTLAVGEDPTLDTLMQSLTLPSTNWQLSQNNATDGYIRDCVADQRDAGHWTFTWQYVSGQDSSSFSQGDEFSLYYTAQPDIWQLVSTGGATTGNVVFDGDQLYVVGTGYLDLKNTANQVELGANNAGPVIVSTDEGTNRWEFGADGALTLPGAITVDATYNSLTAEFDGGNGEYYLIILKEEWPTANVEIQAGDTISKATDPATSLVVTGAVLDDGIYWLAPTGNSYIAGGTMSFNLSRPKPEWQFNANSTIILPPGGDILDSNGASVLGGNTSTTNQLVNSIYELTLQANGAVTVPGTIVARNTDDPASYRGFYATVNQISEQDSDPSLNQIVLSRSDTMRGYDLSTNTNNDTFFANGITGSSHVAVINLYGADPSNPIALADIKTFVQTYIDLVLFDGAALRTDVAEIQSAFDTAQTDLVNSLPANTLQTDFEFREIQAVINTAGMTTSGTGSGFVYYYNNSTRNYNNSDTTSILVAGTGYQVNDTITVPGTALGGIAPADNMTITVIEVDGSGGIIDVDRSGSMDNARFANLFVQHSIYDGQDDAYDQGNFIGTDRSECVFTTTANAATGRITVSAVTSGELAPYQVFSQGDDNYNYMILHQVSGTAGGAGTYVTGGYDEISTQANATTYTSNGIYYGVNDPQYNSSAFGGGDYVSMVNTSVGIFTMVAVNADIDRVSYLGETGADGGGIKTLTTNFDISTGVVEYPAIELVVGTNTWSFDNTGNLTLPQTSGRGITFGDGTFQKTAYKRPDNLMLDGGAAATIYEVTVDYAEGGFSSTRYGVNTPSFNGGSAELDEAIYYTLDGGGA